MSVDPTDASKCGTRFKVVSAAKVTRGGGKLLRIFGEPDGAELVNACQTALVWVRLHQSALRAHFNGAVADWTNPDLRWWMEMVEVGTGGYKKSGGSVSRWLSATSPGRRWCGRGPLL